MWACAQRPVTEPSESHMSPESDETLESAILGARPELTSDDVARASGFTPEQTVRFWRALGFATARSEPVFTDADVRALSLVASSMESGDLDEETLLRMTRALGQSMARLADWQVGTLANRIEQLESGDKAVGSRLASAMRLVELVGPTFEELLLYVWRRHLAAAAVRVEEWGEHEEHLNLARLTIGFADLVGFSAYSNELTREEIGEMVEEFENRCLDAVARRRGRVIKTLGDSVLFVADTPLAAYGVAEEIIKQIGASPTLPDVRIGLATGPVVLRLGDVFGPAVNLAARMTSVARRNRVICDAETAVALPAEEFEIRHLPPRPVRGFGDVAPIAVRHRAID